MDWIAGTVRRAALLLVVAACAGPGNGGSSGAGAPPQGRGGMMGQGGMMRGGGMMGQGGMVAGPADTAAAPQARAAAATAPGCPPVSQTVVDAGRSIFTGRGNCSACHGSNAQGTALAPNLTDAQWLDTDGSYGGIATVVRSGVPDPKQHTAPMPAEGGAALGAGQLCAVAAYVYSMSHAGA